MFSNFDVYNLLLLIIPLLTALTIHEYGHALAAHLLGDDTAKDAGRLTLNPFAHLDLYGTLAIVVTQFFGWAKPVPFNPSNLRNPARDTSLVALAGPLGNFIVAAIVIILLNVFIGLDLYKLLSNSMQEIFIRIFYLTFYLNMILGIFNLLPLPPLDGFKVISIFLPHQLLAAVYRNELICFFALIMVIIFIQPGKYIAPFVNTLFSSLII